MIQKKNDSRKTDKVSCCFFVWKTKNYDSVFVRRYSEGDMPVML